MSIEYTNKPVRLKVSAILEFEDGQVFDFSTKTTDFSEDGETIVSNFDKISSEVYDKLEEFTVESKDDDWDDFDEELELIQIQEQLFEEDDEV